MDEQVGGWLAGWLADLLRKIKITPWQILPSGFKVLSLHLLSAMAS